MRQVAKKEWIKTSFWMPENNSAKEAVKEEAQGLQKKQRMQCPYASSQEASHSVKFKELLKLRLKEDS